MDNDKGSRGIFARFFNTLIQIGLGESLLRTRDSGSVCCFSGGGDLAFADVLCSNRGSRQRGKCSHNGGNPGCRRDRKRLFGKRGCIWRHPAFGAGTYHHPITASEEIVKYTVQEGDTLFGIAEKFGLKPETILWGNYYVLLDDPHALKPGQELNILPVNGTYHEWQAGEGLNGVATYYGVTPEDIINYPTNNLDASTIGDFANPNIPPGTWLIVPNGRREFISWSAPLGVTRENPASARVLGPGACDPVSGGAVGFGTFIWPANKHYLSGFDYSPSTNHWGIDIAGNEGEGVYATDAGVVVYAGWNNYGYGNMVMIDHGNGFQSLYGHMSAFNVGCGQSVGQGDVIGAIGTTGRSSGPHLHFEIRAISSWVNPVGCVTTV